WPSSSGPCSSTAGAGSARNSRSRSGGRTRARYASPMARTRCIAVRSAASSSASTDETMSDTAHDALVSTEWLAAHLGDEDVRPVDGSWHLPSARRDAAAEFAARHIPGAVFFDIDAVADTDTPLPHMLPSPEKFARA